MMAQANGWSIGTEYADLEYLREKMYYPGQGTSGADMASYLRSQGLGKSYFTTGGTEQDVIESLKSGQPVPFGVVSTHGQIVEIREGGSTNYPNARSGDSHHRVFGENGHWVLITGTEGDPDNPSAYIVNDPDLGGQLRVTPSQLSQMGAGSGNFWLVGQ